MDHSKHSQEEHQKHYFVLMCCYGTEGMSKIMDPNNQKVICYSTSPFKAIKKKIKNSLIASTFKVDVNQPFHKIIEFSELMNTHITYGKSSFLKMIAHSIIESPINYSSI